MKAALPIVIILSYLGATALLWRHNQNQSRHLLTGFTILLGAALLAHYVLAANTSYVQHSFNFSVVSMTYWVSAMVITLFAIGMTIYPIRNLAMLVLPCAALCLLFAALWQDNVKLISEQGTLFYWHIGLSIGGFTVLSLSVLQSALLALQDTSLKHHRHPRLLSLLPPLQTMERVLFQLLKIGFLLLTLAIVLGALYNQQTEGSLFSLTHHNLLALFGWLTLAILLFGNSLYGWRGIQAAKWASGSFAFILLGYFGSKVVSELLV